MKSVVNIEKKMVQTLGYRLLPDTTNFWLESVIKFWDHYAMHKKPSPLPIFFKKTIHWDENNQMVLTPVALQ